MTSLGPDPDGARTIAPEHNEAKSFEPMGRPPFAGIRLNGPSTSRSTVAGHGPGLSRAFAMLLAAGCAVALVVALGVFHILVPLRAPSSVRSTELLGRGDMILHVPIMTMYTAPPLPGQSITSNVTWSVRSTHNGPSTSYHLGWKVLSGPAVPVRFVLNSTFSDPNAGSTGPSEGRDEFSYYPAGTCGLGCTDRGLDQRVSGPGVADVVYVIWKLTYAVLNVTETSGAAHSSFLEVDFSLSPMGSVGEPMPAANVSRPSAKDLASVAIENIPAGNQLTISARGLPAVPNIFRHDATTAAFDAGRLGTLTARLTTQYSWSSVDDYRLSFSATTNVSLQFFLDLRFGSLLIEYVSPEG
jgi:hypothetical protein